MPNNRTFHVDIDVDKDGQFFAKCHPMFSKELGKFLRDVADRARVLIREKHEKTGKLRRSVQPYKGRAAVVRQTSPTSISGTVTAGSRLAPYARAVHQGSRAHVIKAKPGRSLSFVGAGKNGRKTFRRERLRMLNDQEWADLENAAQGTSDEAAWADLRAAEKRYNRRVATYKRFGHMGYLRRRDADVTIEETEHFYKERRVVIDQVNHPGTKPSPFLLVALNQVYSRRFGGRLGFVPGGGRAIRLNS